MVNHLKSWLQHPESLSDDSNITISKVEYEEMKDKILEYQQIFNRVALGIITLNKNLIYTSWNRFMEKLTWYKTSDIIWKHPSQVFPELVELGLIECLDDILNDNSKWFSIQNDFSIPKTERTWTLRETYQPLFNKEWEINWILIKVDDITERKQLYQALEECKSLMTLFFKNSPIYAYIKEVTETESRVLIASDNYINMIWIESSYMTWKSMSELFPEELAKQMTLDDISVVTNNKIINKEEELNGRQYRTIKFPINIWEKKLIAWYSIDITDILEKDELLKVREEQLAIKTRMELLSNFSRGTAHDFNNILSPVLNYLEIVLEKSPELTDDTRKKIGIALESTMRAIESVRIIADCANNNVLEKEDFDISILVSELFGSINHEDSGKINMINELKEWAFYVKWNKSYIHKVLLNLINNSSNASATNITIKAEDYKSWNIDKTNLPEGEYVHIIVEDNWNWMSKKVLKQAFDPFFTTGWVKGDRLKWLWLYRDYNIITYSHNGHVFIKSEEWIWTTVDIYLPKWYKKDVEDEEDLKQEVVTIPEPKDQTILVVDDDKVIREMNQIMLEMKGYKVITAIDWEDWLEKYINNPSIDCILLDLKMPKKSGWEVLQEIRNTKDEVAIVLLTWNSGLETWNDSVLRLANALLNKPVEMKELLTTISKVIDEVRNKKRER